MPFLSQKLDSNITQNTKMLPLHSPASEIHQFQPTNPHDTVLCMQPHEKPTTNKATLINVHNKL